VVDLLNHASDGGTLAFGGDGGMCVRTTRSYAAGEEVTLNYGDKSTADLLACYGIPPASP
jgi:hypothetical protein